jgi:DNA-binding transcriptional ArsR family regulator
MLQPLFGSKSREAVLAFLVSHSEGYASEIASVAGLDLFAVQQQLVKLERAGLLSSRTVGRKRLYALNPRYPLLPELKRLIHTALNLQPPAVRSASPLPKSLREYFWDYPFEQLSWKADRDLIIHRLLSAGSWEAVTWLRKQTGDEALRQWLIDHRGRGLSARQLRFWSLILALPRKQTDAWVRAARAGAWSRR